MAVRRLVQCPVCRWLNERLFVASLRSSRGEGAINNLVDRVNGFPFAGTAAKNKDTGDQAVLLVIITIVLPVAFTVLPKNNARYADGLPTVATMDSAEMGGRCNSRHDDDSLRTHGVPSEAQHIGMQMALSTVRIDNCGHKKK